MNSYDEFFCCFYETEEEMTKSCGHSKRKRETNEIRFVSIMKGIADKICTFPCAPFCYFC